MYGRVREGDEGEPGEARGGESHAFSFFKVDSSGYPLYVINNQPSEFTCNLTQQPKNYNFYNDNNEHVEYVLSG